jgi:hypothetical protein
MSQPRPGAFCFYPVPTDTSIDLGIVNPDPVERITLPAAVSVGGLLDPAAHA